MTPNVGFRVAPVSSVELLELTKTKTYLELTLLRESMAFGGLDWEAKIIATHYTLSREEPNLEPENNPEGFTSWSVAHEAFHESLICANKSPWLFRFYRQATEHIRRHGRALRYTNPYVHSGTTVDAMQASPSLRNSSSLELHTDLKDAVIKRQNDKAEMLLIKHNDLTVLAYEELGILG
nr:FCD domain-containing protein [Pseudochrobactrum asaccharolyticum]